MLRSKVSAGGLAILVAMNERVVIPSVTGVDLELEIAGPGGRSYAYTIDWHIRLLLAVAWWALGTFLFFGGIEFVEQDDPEFSPYMFTVLIPAAALYVLYHPVLEVAMRGRTPGKRIAGIRIVNLAGETPSVGALLIRNLLRLVDSLPTGYIVGLVATVITKNSVRIGDLAAGTLLIYEDSNDTGMQQLQFSQATVDRHGIDNAELISELLARWDQLAPSVRNNLATKLLTNIHDKPPAAVSDAQLHQLLKANA